MNQQIDTFTWFIIAQWIECWPGDCKTRVRIQLTPDDFFQHLFEIK